jgi:ribosomal protein L44E
LMLGIWFGMRRPLWSSEASIFLSASSPAASGGNAMSGCPVATAQLQSRFGKRIHHRQVPISIGQCVDRYTCQPPRHTIIRASASILSINRSMTAVLMHRSGQTKPVFHKKAKTTKKIVLRLECNVCKQKSQLPIKRCKHFELGLVCEEVRPARLTVMAAATRRPRARPSCSDGLFRASCWGVLIHCGIRASRVICTSACMSAGRNQSVFAMPTAESGSGDSRLSDTFTCCTRPQRAAGRVRLAGVDSSLSRGLRHSTSLSCWSFSSKKL